MKVMDNNRPDNNEDARILHRVQAVVEHLKGSGLKRKTYNTALILLAAALLGPNVLLIAQELDLDYAFVEKIGNRMTASRLWSMDTVYTEDWVYEEPFFDGFFEQLAVAEGLVTAVPSSDGFDYIPAREPSTSVM